MEAAQAKTPAQLADEARQTGRDAVEAAQGLAQEAKAIGSDTAQVIRSNAADASATAQEAIGTAKGVAGDAVGIAKDAVATGRAYAKGAATAASDKLRDAKLQASQLKGQGERYVAENPVQSVLYAMAAGAALMLLVKSSLRSRY